jgi:hypothetical protein
VTLPRHEMIEALDVELLARWQKFEVGVASHEQEHVAISLGTVQEFREGLISEYSREFDSCGRLESELDAAFGQVIRSEEARQDAYHSRVRVLRTETTRPLEIQLEATETELGQLKSTKGAIDSDIQSIALGISSIEDAHAGETIPSGAYEEYQSLISRHNEQVEESNLLAARINESVSAYNRLAEELAWLR